MKAVCNHSATWKTTQAACMKPGQYSNSEVKLSYCSNCKNCRHWKDYVLCGRAVSIAAGRKVIRAGHVPVINWLGSVGGWYGQARSSPASFRCWWRSCDVMVGARGVPRQTTRRKLRKLPAGGRTRRRWRQMAHTNNIGVNSAFNDVIINCVGRLSAWHDKAFGWYAWTSALSNTSAANGRLASDDMNTE